MTAAFLQRWRQRLGLDVLGLNERRCTFCLRPFQPDRLPAHLEFLPAGLLCPQCRAHFAPARGPFCQTCGLPAEGARITRCGHCLAQPPPWDGLAFWGMYEGELRQALLRLKFDAELSLAPLLAACLLQASTCLPRPDAILAIPQHPSHLRQRGFNQAHELAKCLHESSGLPLRAGLLRKIRHTPSQAQLSAKARIQNPLGSFAALPEVQGMRIWLLDDVMTTGSTLRAACHCLLQAGAKRVSVLFAARTPPPH